MTEKWLKNKRSIKSFFSHFSVVFQSFFSHFSVIFQSTHSDFLWPLFCRLSVARDLFPAAPQTQIDGDPTVWGAAIPSDTNRWKLYCFSYSNSIRHKIGGDPTVSATPVPSPMRHMYWCQKGNIIPRWDWECTPYRSVAGFCSSGYPFLSASDLPPTAPRFLVRTSRTLLGWG